ncbi:MAG: polyprenyl synthetase family protein [Bdellovibrionales bacterium]|nr:polyprenyl synthetase family protein [Bdellovibrionales bacterium]
MSLNEHLARYKALLEPALSREIADITVSESLHKAMQYSLMAGGKRIRPALAFAAAEALGKPIEDALPAACAIEMIHTYSLIHDDLPAMDDDDLRRGQPTCHKEFGEALAILAGDALLTQAFSCLSSPKWLISADKQLQIISVMAGGAGGLGMVAGQVLDLEFEGRSCTETQLKKIHTHKTGRLLSSAVVCGAICGQASQSQLEQFEIFGNAIGLAFQIADDVLDVTGTTKELGKDSNSDLKKGKATYPSVLGIDRAKEEAQNLLSQALDSISSFQPQADALSLIAKYIVERRT